MPSTSTPQIVYIVRCGDSYKIGRAQNVWRRIDTLQTGAPQKLELMYTVNSPDARVTEGTLHLLFRAKRVHGEWFALTDEDFDRLHTLPTWVGEFTMHASHKPPAVDEPVLTEERVAALLSVSCALVRRVMRSGEMPARMTRPQLEAWLDEQAERSAQAAS
ncbi:MAG: GIY-YIG nuclease family protein [Chloroflexota bacterium]|nr:GIY-YIG nuclease family protein [Chloroflexota bacterium]